MMGRIRYTFIFLFLTFPYTPGFALQGKVPNDHLHSFSQCVACHPDGVDLANDSIIGKQCMQCHSKKRITLLLNDLKNGKYQNKKSTSNTSLNNKAYYYKNSKYGDSPHEMVAIPAGNFIMGTNDRLSDEGPQHQVFVNAFQIDKYEVTNLQYKKFITETKHRSPSHFRNRTYPERKVDHPVTFVSWHDANTYCKWANKRLPTAQEWEKAARSDDGRNYPWGNDFIISNANTPLRWEKLQQSGDTVPIGLFPNGVSPYGIHDMSGNVWEWTSSWYKPYPGNLIDSENYGERYITLKGGSWFDCSFYKCGISAPVYNRAFFAKKVKNDTFGFRCAKNYP